MLVASVNRSRLSPAHDRPVATHNAAETTPRASNSDAGGLGGVCASSRTPMGRVHGEVDLVQADIGATKWVAPVARSLEPRRSAVLISGLATHDGGLGPFLTD